MIPSAKFYERLKEYEGLELEAYKDQAGIATIGIGTILYPDGRRVKMGDKCTYTQAMEYAVYEADNKAEKINELLEDTFINQQQFDAILLLVYNIGEGGFAMSTVLKRIKAGAPPESIAEAWLRWDKVRNPKTKVLEPNKGLQIRRKKELALYFS